MEPTIYKPSIYKGTGIYKAVGEGGGGGDSIYRVTIDGRVYPVTRITGEGYDRYWLAANLSCTSGMAENTHYRKNTSYHNFIYYKNTSLSLIRALLPEGWDFATLNDFEKLKEIHGHSTSQYINEAEGGQNNIGLDFYYSGRYSTYNGAYREVGEEVVYYTGDDYGKVISLYSNWFTISDNGNKTDFIPLRVCKDA